MDKAKEPIFRFKRYTDDWVQRKLIDGCDYVDYRGKTPTKTEDGVFLVTAKNVKAGYIDYEASQEYIAEEDYDEVMHRGLPKIGDVLITTEAPCGNVAQVDRKDIALAQRIIKYRGHENQIDNTYLKHYLLTPYFQGVLQAKSSGGTVQGIKGSILHQQIIRHPCFEEQVKIGRHLDSIDNLITLHQRKCDALKELKKGMLQKMFPKEGAKVPEFRFKGFTGDWVQRKFSDIAETRRGLTYKPTDVNEGGIRVLRSSNINDDLFEVHEDDVFVNINAVNIPYTKNGDILITSANGSNRLVGKHTIVKGIEENSTVHGGFMLIASSDEPEFVNASMSSAWYTNFIKVFVAGGNGAIGNLNKKDLDEQDVLVPCREERDRIGSFFSNLDNLITLHQRKLAKLQALKKAYLTEMFP